MSKISLNKLLDIGIALSKEKDMDKLLEIILREAMDITACDGGTLYLLNDDALDFKIMITKSMDFFKGGKGDPIDLPPVKLSRQNACACAALDGKLINIADVYDSDKYDFSGPRKYDAMTGYKTTSMLMVPMENDYGDIIGVLQLINAKDAAGNTIPFDSAFEHVIASLASQCAICVTNMKYAEDIIELLDSFVRVMSTAIDARTPYNANHTKNMVKYGSRFIDWLNAQNGDWQFSDAEKRQFLMSVWLHDVGKLVIPLEVMDKESRLGHALNDVLHRFEVISLTYRIHFLNGDLDAAAFEQKNAELQETKDLIIKANTAGFLPDPLLDQIKEVASRSYTDINGEQQPWLTADELIYLTVQKGTLTAEERKTMESHVVMTGKMLGEMKFSRDYLMVPKWAAEHHEFINGRGYPNKLSGDEIPQEVRLLTVLDIFDALTARDRPYKPAMPLEKALGILDSMANDGQIDASVLQMFKASKAWED